MKKTIELFSKTGLVKFKYNFGSNQKTYHTFIQYLTNYTSIESTGKIFHSQDKSSLINPYYGNSILELHNDGLGESYINPIYIFLNCIKQADGGGENFFVDSKKILKIIPQEYLELKYNFSLFDGSEESLFIEHPVKGFLCLNYTLHGSDKEGNSNHISFLGKSKDENSKIQIFLYNLLKEHTFFVDIKEGESLIFDNYRYLHGRNSFSGYRELERFLVHLK